MSPLKSTTSLSVIRNWAEQRGGKPARVKGSVRKGSGLLRISFSGQGREEPLEEIPWDVWYEIFRNSNLKFLYYEKPKGGIETGFFKLVDKNHSH